MSEKTRYQLKQIEYGSEEYDRAARLRYRLFYEQHHIPFESIFDDREKEDWHLAILEILPNRVLAYGRLSRNRDNEFQIYQLVVVPEKQRQGLGKQMLQALTQLAARKGAERLTLNARVVQMEFYQKSGFQPVGEIFPSPKTGVPHIKMQKKILS